MTEVEAKNKINDAVSVLLGSDSVNIASRKSLNRLEHIVTYTIVFKHDEEKEIQVVNTVKKLTLTQPDLNFVGSEVNDKFNMEFVAVLVAATIKK